MLFSCHRGLVWPIYGQSWHTGLSRAYGTCIVGGQKFIQSGNEWQPRQFCVLRFSALRFPAFVVRASSIWFVQTSNRRTWNMYSFEKVPMSSDGPLFNQFRSCLKPIRTKQQRPLQRQPSYTPWLCQDSERGIVTNRRMARMMRLTIDSSPFFEHHSSFED